MTAPESPSSRDPQLPWAWPLASVIKSPSCPECTTLGWDGVPACKGHWMAWEMSLASHRVKAGPESNKSAIQKTVSSILRGSCMPWSLKLSLHMKGTEAHQMMREKQPQLHSVGQLWAGTGGSNPEGLMHNHQKKKRRKWSRSVMSDCLQPHGL